MCVAIYILHPESIQIPSHFALDLVLMDKSALVLMFALWQCGWWNLTHMGLLFRNCPYVANLILPHMDSNQG